MHIDVLSLLTSDRSSSRPRLQIFFPDLICVERDYTSFENGGRRKFYLLIFLL